MFNWIKKLFGKGEPEVEVALDINYGLNPDGTLPVSDTDEDQTEFKTYAEAVSWVFKWNRVAFFEWDDKKKMFVRETTT